MRRISQVTEAESWGGGIMLSRGQQMPYLGEQDKTVPLRSQNKFTMDSLSWGCRWTRLKGYTASAKVTSGLGALMKSVDFILKAMGGYKRMQKTFTPVVTGKITLLLKRWKIWSLDELILRERPSQAGDYGLGKLEVTKRKPYPRSPWLLLKSEWSSSCLWDPK